MRKATFIIALSLMTVLLTGHYFIYQSVLKSHKNEFKTYIRTHFTKIEELAINPSQLYTDNHEMIWLDNNKEVCLKGVMYDVISIKNAGVKVVLNLVKDNDEKELMNRYQKHFEENCQNANTSQKSNNLIKDFLSLKFLQKTISQIVLFTSNHNYSRPFKSNIKLVYLSVQTPPPLT